MNDLNAVIDQAKARLGVGSDYKLALMLGIGDGNLRNYRHGRSMPTEVVCVKLAEAAGIDPAAFVAQVQAWRSSTDQARGIWQGIAQRLGGALAAVFVALVGFGGHHSPANALQAPGASPGVYYVKWRRAWHRWCLRLSQWAFGHVPRTHSDPAPALLA